LTDAARGLDLPALSAAGFDLVVLLPVPVWALARFVREALPHSPDLAARLFADEGAAAYAALGCTFRFSTAKLKPDTIHAHTPVWKAALWGIGEGLRGGPQGDVRWMGGAWVLESGAAVWAHKDEFNADQVPIPTLLAAAGAPASAYAHHARPYG
jgi:hypothetical protein